MLKSCPLQRAMQASDMFEKIEKARADMKPGTLYAVAGESGWIYYGQVSSDKSVGFFRIRDSEILSGEGVLASPIMSVVSVSYPSIGRALRSGFWKRLGRFSLASTLKFPHPTVQWPVGTLTVTVHQHGLPPYDTRVEDPKIQAFEQMAVWDAEYHIPKRLTADFGAEPSEWHVSGPIWRARRVKEEYAARFPDMPWHRLPSDWVPVGFRQDE